MSRRSRLLSDATYCDGKCAYDKKGAITARNLRYRQDHVELRIYECNDNGYSHWHLTHQMRRRKML